MTTSKTKAFIATSAAALVLAAAGIQPARATDVFQLEGHGAISRAMGGTATAWDVGPAGMLSNPATLSLAPDGKRAMIGADIVTTDIQVTDQATGESVKSGRHSDNRGPYIAPEAAFSGRSGNFTYGLGAFAMGGLGTEYGNSSFLSRANGNLATGLDNSSRLLVLDIPFAASYQVNDKLAVGGSIDAMWQGLNLNLLLGADQVGSLIGSGRASGSLVPVLGGLPDLRGAHFSLTRNQPLTSGVSAWGYSGRLGMVYRAAADTTLGAAYTMRSQMADMSGDATLTAVDANLGQLAMTGKIKIQDFQMPARLDLGVSRQISPQWTLAADLSRVFWQEVMKDIKVAFQADGGGNLNVQLPQNYKDQMVLALGAAYRLDSAWTLRGGFRLATQALRPETMFAVIPAIPRKHVSAGFSYAFANASRIDFGYSHAFSEKMDNGSQPNTSASAPISVTHAQDSATLNYTHAF